MCYVVILYKVFIFYHLQYYNASESKKIDSACKKTYKSTPRSFISINYMHIFEQNHFRQTHLVSILKNGRHLGFFNGTSGRFVK